MKIVITSEARLLHVVRCVVRYVSQQVGFPGPAIDALAMAIDEAATNVIRHGYANRRDALLGLEVLVFPDRVEFILEDSAPKVPTRSIRPRSLDRVRPGGLGTHFINKIMDSSSYDESFSGGNRLRMIKYLSGVGHSS